MIILLSDLKETFQFALEIPGYFLKLTSLMEASNSWTIILPLERLLGNKVVHMQEKAQDPAGQFKVSASRKATFWKNKYHIPLRTSCRRPFALYLIAFLVQLCYFYYF